MNPSDSHQPSEEQLANKKWYHVGSKTLTVIWVLFLAYIALIFYFFINFGSSSKPETASTFTQDSMLEISPADSLLGAFFNAFEAGDFDEARRLATELKLKHHESPHAQRAADLIVSLDSETATDQPLANTEPEQTKRSPSPPKKTEKKPFKTVSRSTNGNTGAITPPRQFVDQIRLDDALQRMRKVYDRQRGISWYYNKNISHYVYKNSFEAYIGMNEEGNVWLRMRIYYTGDDLLNIEAYEVNVNDKDYTITTLYGKMDRGRGSGGAWEWYDAQVSQKELNMIEEVMQPGPTAIRYIGKNGAFERMMTEPEKLRLKHVLEAYQLLSMRQAYLSSLIR